MRERGTVITFDREKGFGFISRQNNCDLFVHYSRIWADGFRELHVGQEVEFSVEAADKGLMAVDVTVVDDCRF